jgi:hypothetical protein
MAFMKQELQPRSAPTEHRAGAQQSPPPWCPARRILEAAGANSRGESAHRPQNGSEGRRAEGLTQLGPGAIDKRAGVVPSPDAALPNLAGAIQIVDLYHARGTCGTWPPDCSPKMMGRAKRGWRAVWTAGRGKSEALVKTIRILGPRGEELAHVVTTNRSTLSPMQLACAI